MILRDRDSDANGSLDERLHAVHDANFNVVDLLDTSGTVVERFAYDAFGVFSVLTPAWGARGSSSYAWIYLHQGGRWDADGSVFSFRHREYSPTLGRWFQLDPDQFDGEESNWYLSYGNNSLTHVDPQGLTKFKFDLKPGKPALGKCGTFEWKIRWEITPASIEGGVIIQKVTSTIW